MKNHLWISACGLVAVMGCGSKDQQPAPQTAVNQPGYPQQPGQPGYGQYPQQPGQPGYGQYPQQPGQPGMPPTTTGAPGQPTQPGMPPAPGQPGAPGTGVPQQPGQPGGFPFPGMPQGQSQPSGPVAQGLDPAAASAAAVPLLTAAGTDAPGMQKEGNAMAGMFQEGQVLEQDISIVPGKCYTFIAQGTPPITEVDITLQAVTPIPGMSPLLGQDSTKGAKAVLGPKAQCIKLAILPMAVQAKWVVKATKGAGLIAAQAFSK